MQNRFNEINTTQIHMHNFRIPYFLVLLTGLFSGSAMAGCKDDLLSDFAREKNGPAIIRVEKVYGALAYRMPSGAQQWDANFSKSDFVPPEKLSELLNNESVLKTSCGMWVDGRVLMKLPAGTSIQVSSPTQKSYMPQKLATGYVYYIMQGFMLEAIDLYPVAAKGISPPAPEPLKQRPEGKEVPDTALCPGNKLPDLKQAAYDSLGDSTKTWFRKLSPETQLEYLCGQWLSSEMIRFPNMGAKEEKDRAAILHNFKELLLAGQVPRNEKGDAQWLSAGSGLLRGNDDWDVVLPLQKEFYDLFEQTVLPHLTAPMPYENGYSNTELLKHTQSMPAELGLRVLKKFNEKKFLAFPHEKQEKKSTLPDWTVALELLQRYRDIGKVNPAVFDYLLAQAGPDAINDRTLMDHAMDSKNLAAVQRLLDHGANPLRDGVLSHAWGKPAYAILLAAAKEKYKASKARTILPPAEAEAILANVLEAASYEKKLDWQEVDFLISAGADINHMFAQQSPNNIGIFAHHYPEKIIQLIARGLRLDKNYEYSNGKTKISGELLMLYLRFTGVRPHREDLIRAMLTKYNNVNSAAGCQACGYPLDFAAESGRADLVKTFIEFGANPNNALPDGSLSYWQAVIKNQPDLLDLMAASKFKLNLNAKDKNGVTALAWAHCLKADAAAAWLSKNGALEIGREICAKAK
ncbi:hypothetical protein ACO0LC_19360 [Undibacterium sp. JH2W]|uniref:hypothetical protein n=1 Tax=Undibacterium sp. JH2W TaxID=3413037 RepID=UPI003BF232CE